MSSILSAPLLGRARGEGLSVPPERIVHLGLGAFHRAHEAWYTHHAADSDQWGIVAFSGRSRELPSALGMQDGLYTLVERGRIEDHFETIGSIVRAVPGDDVAEFVRVVSDPAIAILSLTITEAGYCLDADGSLDLSDRGILADIEAIASVTSAQPTPERPPSTAIGRIVLALDARRRAAAGPIAIMPCDNLPDNGAVIRRALTAFAVRVSAELTEWLRTEAACVSTSVDRITPSVEAAESELVQSVTGRSDAVPVVTEPFSDWVLSGSFPAGRPGWEAAGARFVDDIEPWENRKLWLLNGAHTHLASAGRLRGHATVAEAIGDPLCRAEVEQFWDEAVQHLSSVEVAGYRAALLERFDNARIEHRLDQIAQGSLTKLRVRIVPVAWLERAAGRPAEACARVLGTWIAQGLRAGELTTPRPEDALALIDGALASDLTFSDSVTRFAHSTLQDTPT